MISINQSKSLDDLVKGVKQLLKRSRYSFSDEDIEILKQVLHKLEHLKAQTGPPRQPDLRLFVEALEMLIRLFTYADSFKDIL